MEGRARAKERLHRFFFFSLIGQECVGISVDFCQSLGRRRLCRHLPTCLVGNDLIWAHSLIDLLLSGDYWTGCLSPRANPASGHLGLRGQVGQGLRRLSHCRYVQSGSMCKEMLYFVCEFMEHE